LASRLYHLPMASASHLVRLLTAHAFLRSACDYLQQPPPTTIPPQVGLADAADQLSVSALADWMEALAQAGLELAPRAGFWRCLENASATLDRPERAAVFHDRFLMAVAGSDRVQS